MDKTCILKTNWRNYEILALGSARIYSCISHSPLKIVSRIIMKKIRLKVPIIYLKNVNFYD
jgi:hypothetical protein